MRMLPPGFTAAGKSEPEDLVEANTTFINSSHDVQTSSLTMSPVAEVYKEEQPFSDWQ